MKQKQADKHFLAVPAELERAVLALTRRGPRIRKSTAHLPEPGESSPRDYRIVSVLKPPNATLFA